MTNHYARVVAGTVVSTMIMDSAHVARLPDADCYFVVPPEVTVGWKHDQDGSFSTPVVPLPTLSLTGEKADRLARIKSEAQERILSVYPVWRQINAALGLDDEAKVSQVKAHIRDVRDASNAAEAAVSVLTTVAGVQGFMW